MRPGSVLEEKVKIGNFVETKKAHLEKGAKASHLSYLGDCRVGSKANIGAGTIFCNYDGYNKHFTSVGAEVFVGSNSALVAPLTIGDGATIGAGSVITRNIDKDALAVTRASLMTKPEWSRIRREKYTKSGKSE
jgi:bifunctional UDP-N-acetylglucosamine pyrophosphorylase/glucosamine-1-phosphate N-acetyltransferase